MLELCSHHLGLYLHAADYDVYADERRLECSHCVGESKDDLFDFFAQEMRL